MTEQPKFLETVGCIGGDVLIPIVDIKSITLAYNKTSIEIAVKMKCGTMEFYECFGIDEEKAQKRYQQIKQIIGAK